MTDRTELWIDLHERALHLEQAARRLLHKSPKVATSATGADLTTACDAYATARQAMADHINAERETEAQAAEEAVEAGPGFEIHSDGS